MAERPQITLNFWGFVMLAIVGVIGLVALAGSLALRLFSARFVGRILVVVVLYQLAFRLLPRLAAGQEFDWWPDFAVLLVAAPLAVHFLALAQMQQTLAAIRESLDDDLLEEAADDAGAATAPVIVDAVVIERPHPRKKHR